MKRLIAALIIGVASIVLFAGCVPITYTKSVTVHKDAQGAITGITEYESVTEQRSAHGRMKGLNKDMPFTHLK